MDSNVFSNSPLEQFIKQCHVCNGNGLKDNESCRNCGGNGFISTWEEKAWVFKMPIFIKVQNKVGILSKRKQIISIIIITVIIIFILINLIG